MRYLLELQNITFECLSKLGLKLWNYWRNKRKKSPFIAFRETSYYSFTNFKAIFRASGGNMKWLFNFFYHKILKIFLDKYSRKLKPFKRLISASFIEIYLYSKASPSFLKVFLWYFIIKVWIRPFDHLLWFLGCFSW